MPSGKNIDWSQYDRFIHEFLPKHTIKELVNKYFPHISEKTISVRARKLGVKPKKYSPSKQHKLAISKSLSKETPEIVPFITKNIDDYSRRELAKLVGLSQARLNDLIGFTTDAKG